MTTNTTDLPSRERPARPHSRRGAAYRGGASAKPILLPTVQKEIQTQRTIWSRHTIAADGITPPAIPCPENGMLPPPLSNCGVPEAPATTLPFPGNMAYYGGHVQVTPKVYIVYWGWGQPGAFPASQTCTPETLTEGTISATLACDPDGAGRYMADFVQQLGGTGWAGVRPSTTRCRAGQKRYITNPTSQLAGIWVDDANSITGLPKTSSSAAPGSGNTYTDLAAEAARAAAHFGVTDLANTNIVIAQPPNYSDPNALSTGYCAFHDYTQPGVQTGIYNGITPNLSYTNMPYSLAINSGGQQLCGENGVNSGAAGKLDGFSIALGHEIEETVTDPGAEDVLGSGLQTTNWAAGTTPSTPTRTATSARTSARTSRPAAVRRSRSRARSVTSPATRAAGSPSSRCGPTPPPAASGTAPARVTICPKGTDRGRSRVRSGAGPATRPAHGQLPIRPAVPRRNSGSNIARTSGARATIPNRASHRAHALEHAEVELPELAVGPRNAGCSPASSAPTRAGSRPGTRDSRSAALPSGSVSVKP